MCVCVCRQLIVNLDGGVEVEVSSGEKRVISAGEVFLEEDVTGQLHFIPHTHVHVLHLGSILMF